MPNRRKNGRRPRPRRRANRRRSEYSQRRINVRSAVLAPPSIFVKLKYSDLTSVSGITFGNRTFGLNCLYDPNISGVGVQPTGFDQWMSIYRRYYVFNVRMAVEFFNTAAATITELCIYPSTGGTSLTTISGAADLPLAKRSSSSGTNGLFRSSLRMGLNIPTFLGRLTAESTFYGSATANPGTVAYGHIALGSADGVTNISGYYRVTLTFAVKFFDVLQLDQS